MGDLNEKDCVKAVKCNYYESFSRLRSRDDNARVVDLVLYGDSCWMGIEEGIDTAVIEVSQTASGAKETVHIYRQENVEGIIPCELLFHGGT